MTDQPVLQLRLASPADAVAIRELTLEAYRPWIAVIGREPAPMTEDYDAAVRTHRFDLAYLGGALVALIETHAEPDHLLVVNIAVSPALHGRGIGRRLLAHAEVLARGAGLATLRLYTNAKMARNIALYRRFGYVIEREAPSPLGGVVVHMVKQL